VSALNEVPPWRPPAPEGDLEHMQAALVEARAAGDLGEVPIGAVVVLDGKVIASAGNRRETDNDPIAHAEMLALRAAGELLGTWRLEGAVLYSTLEPCPMCAGAAWAARVDRVVFGADDIKAGALGSLYHLGADPRLNHEFEVTSGVARDECSQLLRDFFAERRSAGDGDPPVG